MAVREASAIAICSKREPVSIAPAVVVSVLPAQPFDLTILSGMDAPVSCTSFAVATLDIVRRPIRHAANRVRERSRHGPVLELAAAERRGRAADGRSDQATTTWRRP